MMTGLRKYCTTLTCFAVVQWCIIAQSESRGTQQPTIDRADSLEVHFWVLRESDVRAEVEVQAVVRFIIPLQQLNDLGASQLLCVLLGYLHN